MKNYDGFSDGLGKTGIDSTYLTLVQARAKARELEGLLNLLAQSGVIIPEPTDLDLFTSMLANLANLGTILDTLSGGVSDV